VSRHKLQSRTYDYYGEAECDKNLEIALQAVQAAKETAGFAAVKVNGVVVGAVGCVGRGELLRT
jgi:hypothetical protein